MLSRTMLLCTLLFIIFDCMCDRYLAYHNNCKEGIYDYCRFEGDTYATYNYVDGYWYRMN